MGSGPLQVSQFKPERAGVQTATNWWYMMEIPEGGFVEIEDNQEFPFHPPKYGYRPIVRLEFEKGQTNWATDVRKDYYIKFGNPAVYGRLHLETGIWGGFVSLSYIINPDGSRNLEPENENTPPPPPPPIIKTNIVLSPAGGSPATPPGSASSNSVVSEVYRCTTIGGVHGIPGSADETNGSSLFNQPWGVAVDGRGSVYVAESGSSTIRKLTRSHTNWTVTTITGTAGKDGSYDGTNAEARLSHPHGIAADDKGNLYVADTFNHTIRKIRHLGTNWVITTIAGCPGTPGSSDGTNSDAQFNNPGAITIGRHGVLYVTDVQNNTIRKVTPVGPDWVVTTIAGFAGMIHEGGAIHPAWGAADGTNRDARFFAPFGVAADSHDNLYVADYESSTIRKVTPDGTNWIVTTIAGRAGQSGYVDGTNNETRFSSPRAVAVDPDDNPCVVDTGTDTIRMIRQVGTNYVVRTIVGLPWRWGYADGTNNTPQFNFASGIAIDRDGNIFVADLGNNTIRQIVGPGHSEHGTNLVPVIAISLGVLVVGSGLLACGCLWRRKNQLLHEDAIS
jgi:hypothetical protein